MYDISGTLAYQACDKRDIEGERSAYQKAIANTVAWFENGNHSIEELDNRIADLSEHFWNRDIHSSLYLAGLKL